MSPRPTRLIYTMVQDDYDRIVGKIEAARKTSGMMLSGDVPMSSVQDTANHEWCLLGDRMGFDGMSVLPHGNSPLQFSVIQKAKCLNDV